MMIISTKRKHVFYLIENVYCSLENHSYNSHRLFNAVQILSTDCYVYTTTEIKGIFNEKASFYPEWIMFLGEKIKQKTWELLSEDGCFLWLDWVCRWKLQLVCYPAKHQSRRWQQAVCCFGAKHPWMQLSYTPQGHIHCKETSTSVYTKRK